MPEKEIVRVDSKGRITLPKEIRENADIEEGDVFFVDAIHGQIKLTEAVKDPVVVLREYAREEYEKGRTRNLRDYAEEKGIELDE